MFTRMSGSGKVYIAEGKKEISHGILFSRILVIVIWNILVSVTVTPHALQPVVIFIKQCLPDPNDCLFDDALLRFNHPKMTMEEFVTENVHAK